MIFAEQVKKQLLSLIGEMATVPWLFSKNPSTDFSRTRKLDFASTIQLILSMESGSIKKELLDFNASFTLEKKYNGYQLLAYDGSDLNIARNPEDKDT